MTTENGLYHAFRLDGSGKGEELDWSGVKHHEPVDGLLWVDLDYSHADSRRWLKSIAQIPAVARLAMTASETRPKLMQFANGLLIILKGVNLNKGASEEDMVSIRIWIDENEIITCRQRQLQSVRTLAKQLRNGQGPKTTGELLTDLTGELATRIRSFVSELEKELDLTESNENRPGKLIEETYSRIRRRAAVMRRHLNPQREALQRLQSYQGSVLGTQDMSELQAHTDAIIYSVEDLEVLREHTQALQDELFSAMSRSQNDRIYMLTLVAAIFLPLTFISGLLGMNVGGIPWSQSPAGFWGIVLICVVIVVLIWLYFRRRSWL